MRRPLVLLSAIAALTISLSSAFGRGVPANDYKTRRAELRKAIGDAVFIAIGATESTSGESRSGFFQEANFYYLTGWTEPGALLVLTPDSETLLIPKRNPEKERWTGPKIGPDSPNIAEITGFQTVGSAEQFEARLPEFLSKASAVYAPKGDIDKLKQLVPLRNVTDASRQLARLRSVKSSGEIEAMQRSVDASIAAHLAAWKAIHPGMMEYEIAGLMSGNYSAEGCGRNAYAPIVGSGPNAATLHYSRNSRRMDSGELLLMDVAAECDMYAADITRTVPVNGKWTPRQRELYDIVLGAQKAAMAAIKPGVMMRSGPNSVHEAAVKYFNEHGKDSHGQPLGKYFTHGLGHQLGLDVHDADPQIPLLEGMIVTVEPGLYIPEENIGIRIEDVVLVTKDGYKLLSAALPREPDEIERVMRSAKP